MNSSWKSSIALLAAITLAGCGGSSTSQGSNNGTNNGDTSGGTSGSGTSSGSGGDTNDGGTPGGSDNDTGNSGTPGGSGNSQRVVKGTLTGSLKKGVQIVLKDGNNQTIGETTTDDNGSYSFDASALADGEYTLIPAIPDANFEHGVSPHQATVRIGAQATGQSKADPPGTPEVNFTSRVLGWTALEQEQKATYNWLYDVWGSGPNDIWAVGEKGTIVHFNGTKWTLVDAGLPSPCYEDYQFPCPLYTVAGSGANDVWIGGAKGTLLHWDGTGTWKIIKDSGTTLNIHDIYVVGPEQFWAVSDNGLLRKPDGTWSQWELGYRTLPSISGSSETDIWATSNWVPPDSSKPTEVLHFDGTSWKPITVAANEEIILFGISSFNSNQALAVGTTGKDLDGNGVTDGVLLQWNGSEWKRGNLDTPGQLYAIWASTPDNMWVSGSQLSMLHWDSTNGSKWIDVPPGNGEFHWGIWGSTPDNVWAVGSRGSIIQWHPIGQDGLIEGTASGSNPPPENGYNVSLTDEGTKQTKTFQTDASGKYSFPGLAPGYYRIEYHRNYLLWDGTPVDELFAETRLVQ